MSCRCRVVTFWAALRPELKGRAVRHSCFLRWLWMGASFLERACLSAWDNVTVPPAPAVPSGRTHLHPELVPEAQRGYGSSQPIIYNIWNTD